MTTTTVIIRDYEPRDQPFFERLYKDWFRNHFQMEPEPVDEYVLTRPGKAVLYTHSSLAPAILLYKKLRFNVATLEPGTYSHLRCDTKMELSSENETDK